MYRAILVGNGTMGARHRTFFESEGVRFVQILDIGNAANISENPACVVDFAVIASPASTHYDYVRNFLQKGVSVFVEKPLALNGEQAQELADIAREKNTTLFVAQSECFNPLFLNFRKHFLKELERFCGEASAEGVRLKFRREHRFSPRCRDVNVSLDLLVHDLGLFFTLFKFEDVDVCDQKLFADGDAASVRLKVARGPYQGVEADFYVNRNSDSDSRTISVEFAEKISAPAASYTISLARYNERGELMHLPESLENEHRFFLKLLAGACSDWGTRLAQTAADAVKVAGKLA